jgi:hypothetical protein
VCLLMRDGVSHVTHLSNIVGDALEIGTVAAVAVSVEKCYRISARFENQGYRLGRREILELQRKIMTIRRRWRLNDKM